MQRPHHAQATVKSHHSQIRTHRALAACVATADSPINRQPRGGKPIIVVVVTPPNSFRRIWPDLLLTLVVAAPMSMPMKATPLLAAGSTEDDDGAMVLRRHAPVLFVLLGVMVSKGAWR